MNNNNVAIYLDFENLAISAEQTYPSREKPLLLRPILDFATSLGNICIKKSYADWSQKIVHQYERKLVKHGFEMRHLPQTSSQGKNGADLQLAIDLLEDMQLFPIIDVFILGSGDTDFIPLIRRVLSRGKRVYVIGFDNSVGTVIKENCTEYKSLEELLGIDEDVAEDAELGTNQLLDENINKLSGRELLIRFIKNRSLEGPILLSQLKPQLIRLQPSFSEKQLGFSSFKQFIESLKEDVVEKIEADPETGHPQVYLKDLAEIENVGIDKSLQISDFLYKTLRCPKDPTVRDELSENLYTLLSPKQPISMHDMVDHIFEKTNGTIPKITIRKFVFALGQGRAFHYADRDYSGPLLSRPQVLNDSIQGSDEIKKIYQDRVIEVIERKYSDIEDELLKSLLN
ncbi:NYN domain protein [Methanoculleus chikugoensis]|uniref:NYN domain protein n=1 Tax=Methanoculleus chikugoensis TaxID=118126 RepID=A0A1M4MP55_9EURY|nr:NYN domain-containing protein [Methanoculleus chikugoensis]SCL76568.1 NYN domain protein [Methanoculleus chikugoensis]